MKSPYETVAGDADLHGVPITVEGGGLLGGNELITEPLVTGNKTYADVDGDIAFHVENFPTRRWWICFIIAGSMLGLLFFSLATLF